MKVLFKKDQFEKFEPINREKSVEEIDDAGITELTTEKAINTPKVMVVTGKTTVVDNPNPNNLWTSHPIKDITMMTADRDRYEWFVAGYLYYYDTVIRNNAVDHKIYFKWETEKVSIYMTPPPLRSISDLKSASANGGTTDPTPPPKPPPPPSGK